MTADLRRLVKKLWRCSKYPSLYTRQRNYKKNIKKRNVYGVRVTFHSCAVLTPPKPLVTPWCMLHFRLHFLSHMAKLWAKTILWAT